MRTIRASTGFENAAIADELGCDVRRVANALVEGRSLLAPLALEILRAVHDHVQTFTPMSSARTRSEAVINSLLVVANGLQRKRGRTAWLKALLAREIFGKASRGLPIAAFITPSEQIAFANFLAEKIAEDLHLNDDRKSRAASAIWKTLQDCSAAMARQWLEQESFRLSRYFLDIEKGAWPYSVLHEATKNPIDFHNAREALKVSAQLAFTVSEPCEHVDRDA